MDSINKVSVDAMLLLFTSTPLHAAHDRVHPDSSLMRLFCIVARRNAAYTLPPVTCNTPVRHLSS